MPCGQQTMNVDWILLGGKSLWFLSYCWVSKTNVSNPKLSHGKMKASSLPFQSAPTLCLLGGCKWWLSSWAHGHFWVPRKSRMASLCSSPRSCKEASEAKEIKESCQKERHCKFLRSPPLPSTWRKKKKPLDVYSLTFSKSSTLIMLWVVIEIHARGNLSNSRNCVIVCRSLLPSLSTQLWAW